MNIYVYSELTQKTQLMLVENTEFEENEMFADDSIRKVWHSSLEEWYLSIFDVVKVLTDSNDPKYIIEYFLCHFRRFVTLSSGNHILFEPLVSTVSMCSETDCGIVCGCKKTPRTKKFARGACCWWCVNSGSAKRQVFLPSNFEPQ